MTSQSGRPEAPAARPRVPLSLLSRYTLAARHYVRANVDLDHLEAQAEARYRTVLETPVTAVYSRVDGVVHWAACIDHRSPNVEHVEVTCSHTGFAFHAESLAVTADRLARPAPGGGLADPLPQVR